MKLPSCKSLVSLLALSLPLTGICAEEPNDPSWTKAADNKIYAQTLVNEALAKNPEIVVIGIHATKPGSNDERMIAANLDRIGKMDDDDDKAGAVDGKTVLAPNLTETDKFEVLIPMHDAGGQIIGAIAFVFKYHPGEDQVNFLVQATRIRDQFAKQLSSKDDLFKVSE